MAIDSSDQKTVSTEAETVIREPEDVETEDSSEPGEGDSSGDGQAAQGSQPVRQPNGQFGKPKTGGNRRERRQAFQQSTQQIEERVSARVAEQMAQFQSQFQQMLQQAQRPSEQPRQAEPDQTMEMLEAALNSEVAALQAHDHRKGPPDFTRYNQLKRRMEALGQERTVLGMFQRLGITPEVLQRLRQPQAAGPHPMEARYYAVRNEFPWISDATHARSVGAYRQYLINGLGRPDTIDTDREACAHVAAQKGLGRQVPRGNPQRYAGMRGGDEGGGRGPREVRLPAGALHGLSKDELAAVQGAMFSDEA